MIYPDRITALLHDQITPSHSIHVRSYSVLCAAQTCPSYPTRPGRDLAVPDSAIDSLAADATQSYARLDSPWSGHCDSTLILPLLHDRDTPNHSMSLLCTAALAFTAVPDLSMPLCAVPYLPLLHCLSSTGLISTLLSHPARSPPTLPMPAVHILNHGTAILIGPRCTGQFRSVLFNPFLAWISVPGL